MAKGKDIARYLDHPFLFLLAIWAGVVALTALSVWLLTATGKLPGLRALILGGKQA